METVLCDHTSTFNILSLLLNTYQMNFVYSFIYLVIHVFYGLNISFSFFFFRRLVPWVPKTFLARFPVSVRRCVKTPKITATRERKPLIPRVHQPFHPWANDCCPRGRNFLCVTDFPKVKIAWENFHGYIEKNKRITHDNDSSPGKFYGLIAEPAHKAEPPFSIEIWNLSMFIWLWRQRTPHACIHRLWG